MQKYSQIYFQPMSLKTERINLGKTPPQEDREKGPPGDIKTEVRHPLEGRLLVQKDGGCLKTER